MISVDVTWSGQQTVAAMWQLDVHRQQCCSVPLACKDEDTLSRKRQQDDFEECMKINSNKLEEARLEKSLLDEPPAELLGFPYLCARDYDSAGGKGDLFSQMDKACTQSSRSNISINRAAM